MKNFYLFLLMLLSTSTLFSQSIVINEIQAKNYYTYQGPFLFDNYLDWIELKNTTNAAIDIGGYFLSDDPTDIQKWSFPVGTTIPANGFLLVHAGGASIYTGSNPTDLNANFTLSSFGETIILSAADASAIDVMTYPPIQNDITYGLLANGTYSMMTNPTVNTTNDDSSAITYLDVDITISQPSGIYANNQSIEITNSGAGQLYYTLDGSTPDNSSFVYISPISINSNTVLKVIAINSPTEYSLVESRSYVFGATHDLPVILLTADNSSYNSNNKEILDGRVEFCFIETDGTTVLNQYTNFTASGVTSGFMPQINGKVKANNVYEDGDFDHQMYPYKTIDEFDSFLFRNASQDWANTHLRDAFVSRLLGQDNLTNTPFEAYRPAVIYVNATYQGIINIREDNDKDYVKHNFGLADDEFLTNHIFNSFVDFSALDFNLAADRSSFASLVDFHEHISLKLLVAYAAPGEYGWRIWEDISGITGTQFHYNFHDFDSTFGLAYDGANFTNIENTPMLVNNLMETQIRDYEPYKQEAIHYIAASINHIYNTNRSCEILDEMQVELESEIPAHAIAMTALANTSNISFNSSTLPFSDLTQWQNNMADLKTNVSYKVDAGIFTRIKNEYGLDNLIQVTYASSDSTHGFVKVHDVKSINENFTGTYFQNIPIRFCAEALPGYQFVRWEGDIISTDIEINPTFTGNASIVAVFEPIVAPAVEIVINELQGKNDFTIADEYGEYDDWIEIYNPGSMPVNLADYYISDNLLEPLKWQIPDTDASKTTVAPNGFLLLWADNDILQGENHLSFKIKASDQVILTAPDASTVIQQVSFIDVNTDTSYGAKIDGYSEFIVFGVPTPEASNNCPLDFEDGSNGQLIETEIGQLHYQTDGTIESIQTIDNNAIIKYDAGECIVLKPGFSTVIGADFEAFIEGCN